MKMESNFSPPLNRSAWRKVGHITMVLSAIGATAVLSGCNKSGGTDPDDQAAKAPATNSTPAETGATLDAATQQRLGLATSLPQATDWQPQIKAYGQVLDPATLETSLMELSRAEIALDSAQQELDRAKVLQGQNNISQRAFQDIETTYNQNLADAKAIQLKIKTAWGNKIAGLMGDLVAPSGTARQPNSQLTTLTDSSSLIRVDLPAGERMSAADAGTVRVIPFATGAAPFEATCFDQMPTMDPQTQQQSWLCVTDRSATNALIPGEAVTAFIIHSGAPVTGVVVPISAVVRYQGMGWVYVQTTTNHFSRVLIPLDRQTDGGWFVSEGLNATNRIVTTGVQSVLSAELSGNGFTTGERD